MAIWQRIFVAPDAIQIEREIGDLIIRMNATNARAVALGVPPPFVQARRELALIVQRRRVGLNRLAKLTAVNATHDIQKFYDASRSGRPGTGNKLHLRTLFFCKPLIRNTGEVGIARESTLDRAKNPFTPGYGTYWRAQEFGTGTVNPGGEIPKQTGRVFRGYFYGPGATGAGEVPRAQYAGGGGPHPIFITGKTRSGVRGGKGGLGEIHKEIKPGHFIRNGANEALIGWRKEMRYFDRRGAQEMAIALSTSRIRRP